ncbi:LacI family DNA-binding transcriptional regulator [Labrenzia sp. OB1]|uniref:LacI family DNA-binding transcriptional regulator n=1 Tax=Labrenzia sp. OB1 TaxID=1561204 RepID=UPI0007B25029|nr:LacI family DNA-binding transcriptional regulator [Labrenzia sp. OB1]KZM48769.1 catabolite control protein A [Labrenzia sp. OB1]
MNRPVTLKDIARETGVHVSTVSRALDPNARTSLTREVVERIRTTAERMGYRPNRLASGLRTKRTMSIGLMIPDIENTLFPPIVRGAESVLEPAGYTSIIVNTDSDRKRETKLVDVLLERGVDGIIHAAPYRSDPRMVEVARRGLPMVTVNRQIENCDIPAVVNDDPGGIAMMLRYLHEKGHRRIAHIAGPKNLSTGRTRIEAFRATAQELHLDLPDEALVVSDYFDEQEGRRCTLQLLDSGTGFTAILCANDRLALGAFDALRRRGLSCPEDVSVTGYNGIPFLDLIPPGLTTIQIPQFDIGRIGAELLIKMMADPDVTIPRTTILPVKLVERGSVKRIDPA